MENNYIYEEDIYATAIIWILSIITGLFVVIFFIGLGYTIAGVDVQTNVIFRVTNTKYWWQPIIFGGIHFLLLMIVKKIKIRMTDDEIKFRFGIWKYTMKIDNIEKVEPDPGLGIKYISVGVFPALMKGKWTLVYNDYCGPRITIHQKNVFFKRFTVTTKRPGEFMKAINEKISQRVEKPQEN